MQTASHKTNTDNPFAIMGPVPERKYMFKMLIGCVAPVIFIYVTLNCLGMIVQKWNDITIFSSEQN